MTKKKIIIFGSSGGVGKEIIKILKKKHYDLFLFNKKKLNFCASNSKNKIHNILKKVKPDIIINASGILGTNKDDYRKIFDVNLMPNWEIVKYYKKIILKKNLLIIIMGSTAYKSGRKNYILYSSSKAALHNLCQGSREYLAGKKITIRLINFGKIYTSMIKKFVRQNSPNVISPAKAALKICKIFDKGI